MSKRYLTVKEFAEARNVTAQAVYKQLDKGLKPYVIVENGKRLIDKEALVLNSSTGINHINQNEPSNTVLNKRIAQLIAENRETEERLKESEALQGRLWDQLAEKDKQISAKDNQIAEMSKQISDINENLKMAQTLAAADKQKILALEAKAEEEQTESKKGFWARLFGL